jgi:hypothetical protein
LPSFRSQLAYVTQGPVTSTDIFPSWFKQKAISSQSVVLDKVSGKVATSCTPDLAKQTLGGNAAPNAFSIDVFYPPGNNASASTSTNNGAPDDVHQCSDSPPTITLTPPSGNICDTSCSISATPFAGTHPLNDSNYPQYPGTVTISVNGNVVCSSSNISDGVPVSCPYSPTFSGSGTITATVTDGVLYSGSDTATVNFTQAVAGPQNLQGTRNGTNASFNWTDGSSPYTIYKNGSALSGNCANTSSSSCSQSVGSGSATFYVQDKNGNKSNSITI